MKEKPVSSYRSWKRGLPTGVVALVLFATSVTGLSARETSSSRLTMYSYDGEPVARYHLDNAWMPE